MSKRKTQGEIISEKLGELNAPMSLQSAFQRVRIYVAYMRNQRLCGQYTQDLQSDLKKINAAMLKALAEVAPDGGWVRLEKIAEGFEEAFGADAVAGYPKSNVARSQVASRILESLGFVGKKQGSRNYTMVNVNADLLMNLTAEFAVDHSIGALVVLEEASEFIKSHSDS
jgi:hypothetical protein